MAIEHPEHAVDLGRNLLAEPLHALLVLLEHHRGRKQLGTLAHALEEALGVLEELLGRHRNLRTPDDVFVREIEPRIGP